MGDVGVVADSCDDDELLDLLIKPSELCPLKLLTLLLLMVILLLLLWFWYRWGDFIVFGGEAWCLDNSHTVIAICTTPLPSRMSAAQHKSFWNYK